MRSLPDSYTPEQPVAVSVAVTPNNSVLAWAVEEGPPDGWVVTNINEAGTWDSVNKKVKWGPFFDANARTLSYTATPPAGESGTKTFDGTASFDGNSVTIEGDNTI